jgi:hypothetical protein
MARRRAKVGLEISCLGLRPAEMFGLLRSGAAVQPLGGGELERVPTRAMDIVQESWTISYVDNSFGHDRPLPARSEVKAWLSDESDYSDFA